MTYYSLFGKLHTNSVEQKISCGDNFEMLFKKKGVVNILFVSFSVRGLQNAVCGAVTVVCIVYVSVLFYGYTVNTPVS